MPFDTNQFVHDLDYKLNVFALSEATDLCEKFVTVLRQSNESIPLERAEKALKLLRRKRMFDVIQKVADTLLQTGRITYNIQRQYAQALIDSGNYTAAIYILQNIINNTNQALPSDTASLAENIEAKGLMGRVYKQLYVNAKTPGNPNSAHHFNLAANAYYEVYSADNNQTWHGINTVAILERAKRDKIELPLKIDSQQLAKDILNTVQKKYDADSANEWDFATAAEACIALNKPEEAVKWLSGYARSSNCDAFELSSTLRQFEEVWQLDIASSMGQYVLPILRSELVKKSGASLTLDASEILAQKKAENKIDKKYEDLIAKTEREAKSTRKTKRSKKDKDKDKLQKVFGDESFKTYKWYMEGAERALAVARIGKHSAKGLGTGFLIKGKFLKASLGDEWFLLTNNHVINNDGTGNAMRPGQAVVIFEALDENQKFRKLKIVWSSPIDELDATLLSFSNEEQKLLKQMTKGLVDYTVSDADLLPVPDPPTDKVYVIGHPYGGPLQISFRDNLMIDNDKKSKIHYRTPTEQGSSGSPVFNEEWHLLALHHSGSREMDRLNGKKGFYEANEGIWLQAIRSKLEQDTSVK